MRIVREFFEGAVTLDQLRPMCQGCHFWRESDRHNCHLVMAMLSLPDYAHLPDEVELSHQQLDLEGKEHAVPRCTRKQPPVPRKEPLTKTPEPVPGQIALFDDTAIHAE